MATNFTFSTAPTGSPFGPTPFSTPTPAIGGGSLFNFGPSTATPSTPSSGNGGTFNFSFSNSNTNNPAPAAGNNGGFGFNNSNSATGFKSPFSTPSANGGFNFGTTTPAAGGFGTLTNSGNSGFNFGTGGINSTGLTGNGGFNFGTTSNGGFTTLGNSTTGLTGNSGFNFGTTTPGGTKTTGLTGNGGFNFGTTSTNTGNSVLSGGFNFGTSTNTPNSGPASTGGFNFGSTATNNTGSFNFGTSANNGNSLTGGFNFGTSNTTGGSITGGLNFGTASSTTPGFNFSSSAANNGVFNFGNTTPSTPNTNGGFSFLNSLSTPNSTQSSATPNTGFTFGNSNPTSGFNFSNSSFGTSNTSGLGLSSANSGFSFSNSSFGGNSLTTPGSTFGSLNSGFSFGTNNSSTPGTNNTNSGFSFSSGTNSNPTGFSFSNTNLPLGFASNNITPNSTNSWGFLGPNTTSSNTSNLLSSNTTSTSTNSSGISGLGTNLTGFNSFNPTTPSIAPTTSFPGFNTSGSSSSLFTPLAPSHSSFPGINTTTNTTPSSGTLFTPSNWGTNVLGSSINTATPTINYWATTPNPIPQTPPTLYLEATLTQKDPFGKLPNVRKSSCPAPVQTVPTTPPLTLIGPQPVKMSVPEKLSGIPQYKISPNGAKVLPRTPLRSTSDHHLGREMKKSLPGKLEFNSLSMSPPSSPYITKIPTKEKDLNPSKTISQQKDNPNPSNFTDILPKLTRPGYFSSPSLEELSIMTKEQLKSVPSFTVGLVDTGIIRFVGTTDVTGLDLDSIIIFKDRTIEVYPNDTNKPPIGQGLNKPAEISLFHCWPKNKGSNVYDTKSLNEFEKKLLEICRENHCNFKSYSKEDGTWIFDVEHL